MLGVQEVDDRHLYIHQVEGEAPLFACPRQSAKENLSLQIDERLSQERVAGSLKMIIVCFMPN